MNSALSSRVNFDKKIIIVGFGSIARAMLPLIFKHVAAAPSQVLIIDKDDSGAAIAKAFGVAFKVQAITRENYLSVLDAVLNPGDLLVNLAVDVSSLDLIKVCQTKNALYVDSSIEPWAGGYVDPNASVSDRSNYAMREAVMQYRAELNQPKGPTAVVTHGANPGLVSHFLKQALLQLAKDNQLSIEEPTTREGWATLAQTLSIRTIHISEHDTQIMGIPKKQNEFVNTWSAEGFISEGSQPAELGWGTHEKHFPHDGCRHDFGSQSAIYLNRPGASTRVRTWTPAAGSFHGYLITHTEAIAIADYLTLTDGKEVVYRPTVHYAYHPCKDAVMSVHELSGREWKEQTHKRVAFDEIIDGMDELGVLLMGNEKGAYWYGSQLSVHEAREIAPYNNATTMQVASGVLGGIVWAIQHPNAGIIEPDDMNHDEVLAVITPYLGVVGGHYTEWTPLKDRGILFEETLDHSDPWQFINTRVN